MAVWCGSPIDSSCTTYSGELIWAGTRPSAFRRAGERGTLWSEPVRRCAAWARARVALGGTRHIWDTTTSAGPRRPYTENTIPRSTGDGTAGTWWVRADRSMTLHTPP